MMLRSPCSSAQTQNPMWYMGPSAEYSSLAVPRDKLNTMTAVSFSYSSSSSSSRSLRSPKCSSPDHSPVSNHPGSPARSFGIPFSWEQLPGIPKKQTPKWRKDKQSSFSSSSSSSSSTTLSLLQLPLPPSTAPNPTKSRSFHLRKTSIVGMCQRDPFIAALVECSKDGDGVDVSCRGSGFWIGARLSRSIGDRVGLVNAFASCKRSCAVSQSIIRLPGTEGAPARSRSLWSRVGPVAYGYDSKLSIRSQATSAADHEGRSSFGTSIIWKFPILERSVFFYIWDSCLANEWV